MTEIPSLFESTLGLQATCAGFEGEGLCYREIGGFWTGKRRAVYHMLLHHKYKRT